MRVKRDLYPSRPGGDAPLSTHIMPPALPLSVPLAEHGLPADFEPRVAMADDLRGRECARRLQELLQSSPKAFLDTLRRLVLDAQTFVQPAVHIAICILSDLAVRLPETYELTTGDTSIWISLVEEGLCKVLERYLVHRERSLLLLSIIPELSPVVLALTRWHHHQETHSPQSRSDDARLQVPLTIATFWESLWKARSLLEGQTSGKLEIDPAWMARQSLAARSSLVMFAFEFGAILANVRKDEHSAWQRVRGRGSLACRKVVLLILLASTNEEATKYVGYCVSILVQLCTGYATPTWFGDFAVDDFVQKDLLPRCRPEEFLICIVRIIEGPFVHADLPLLLRDLSKIVVHPAFHDHYNSSGLLEIVSRIPDLTCLAKLDDNKQWPLYDAVLVFFVGLCTETKAYPRQVARPLLNYDVFGILARASVTLASVDAVGFYYCAACNEKHYDYSPSLLLRHFELIVTESNEVDQRKWLFNTIRQSVRLYWYSTTQALRSLSTSHVEGAAPKCRAMIEYWRSLAATLGLTEAQEFERRAKRSAQIVTARANASKEIGGTAVISSAAKG
ncbi:hypothetical protein PENSPDRAFT_682240 [Peniophora sp. CONT]|nr:hypothetical protein PENSPDRAFT_682240 [Peniophora sp. CONT]